jgi:acyl-CoA synthetase (AMP-forming)/AMP-acid ligase II
VLGSRDTDRPPDAAAECAPGEAGQVWINTPALMRGYFRRDDLTRRAVANGWFLTGDIGYLDARGRLYLSGRERDEINKGGMKIYPSDIDAVVERYEAARDVCAFAIDDPIYGQVVGMAVVLKDANPDTIRGLYAWMKAHLADHKMPSRWWLVDEVPRTSRGKVNRESVRLRCESLPPLAVASLTSDGSPA